MPLHLHYLEHPQANRSRCSITHHLRAIHFTQLTPTAYIFTVNECLLSSPKATKLFCRRCSYCRAHLESTSSRARAEQAPDHSLHSEASSNLQTMPMVAASVNCNPNQNTLKLLVVPFPDLNSPSASLPAVQEESF